MQNMYNIIWMYFALNTLVCVSWCRLKHTTNILTKNWTVMINLKLSFTINANLKLIRGNFQILIIFLIIFLRMFQKKLLAATTLIIIKKLTEKCIYAVWRIHEESVACPRFFSNDTPLFPVGSKCASIIRRLGCRKRCEGPIQQSSLQIDEHKRFEITSVKSSWTVTRLEKSIRAFCSSRIEMLLKRTHTSTRPESRSKARLFCKTDVFGFPLSFSPDFTIQHVNLTLWKINPWINELLKKSCIACFLGNI